MAMSAFHSSDADIRWDDPSTLNTGPDLIDQAAPTTAYTTVVVNGVPTLATPATGTLEVAGAPIPAGQMVAIDGVVLTSVGGGPVGTDEFDGSSPVSETVAANLAAAINGGSVAEWGVATATVVGTTLTLTATETGTDGNTVTLSSTDPLIVPSGEVLAGGAALSKLTVNEVVLTAKVGVESPGLRDFNLNNAGPSLAIAINDPENGIPRVTATWDGICLNIFAAVSGENGNKIPVSSNGPALVVSSPTTHGGTGLPCPPGSDNSRWNILGVNVYRSDTGERGPYFRVNPVPVGGLFYRDRTDIVDVPAESILWDGGWVFKGDAPNSAIFRLRTRYQPMVKAPALGNAVPADSPFDVEVYVDGERVPVVSVFGTTGEVDLSMEPIWNQSTESWDRPPVPTATSVVSIRYYYRRTQLLQNTLDRRFKVFYRVAAVAVDPTGTSPTGLVETPLEYCPPVSPMESEQLDYIWKEAIKRNRWILEQGGERVKLFLRRTNGNPCPCHWDARLLAYSKQPLNSCLKCYGTGFIGGYEGPYDIIVGPDESERRVTQTPNGRKLENMYEVWIGPSPIVSQRDFIVKQNGERFSLGPIRRTQVRGRTLQQAFQIGYLDMGDIRYKVPMSQLERLPWPETRFTSPEDAPCEDAAPYPVGTDPQATPMATEKAAVPDRREQRGRTPVWQNITYGGKGQ